MATVVPITNKYSIGRGIVLFSQRTSGVLLGLLRLGNCPGFTINVKGERIEHKSSESGLSETDLDRAIGVTRTANIECDNLNADNVALFLSASQSTITQASGTVTNEVLGPVLGGRSYRVGTPAIVDGARKISAPTVTISATDFAISTAYTVGQILIPATPNNHAYVVTVAGTSAGTLPTFPTVAGDTVVSGGVTIKEIGTYNTWAVDTDFTIDGNFGFFNILSTGTLATMIANATAAGASLSLKIGYAKAAVTTAQTATGATAGLEGQLVFLEENALDPDNPVEWIFPSASLTPDGDLALITDNKLATLKLAVGINLLDSDTPAIKKNGIPVAA